VHAAGLKASTKETAARLSEILTIQKELEVRVCVCVCVCVCEGMCICLLRQGSCVPGAGRLP